MKHGCEVCDGFRPGAEFGESYRVVEVRFDVRSVHLCVAHARIAENSGVKSFEELREIYGEGRRSFIPRRGASTTPYEGIDRRVTPSRRV